jgi:hypothetical protein
MTREEIVQLPEPIGVRPFTITTSGGLRLNIPHPDFIDMPPKARRSPSHVTVYNRNSVARFIVLTNIDSVEFQAIK